MRIRFAQSSRKHRLGKAVILAIMAENEGDALEGEMGSDPKVKWVGRDPRGFTIEVIAVDLPDYRLVIHAMPHYREDQS